MAIKKLPIQSTFEDRNLGTVDARLANILRFKQYLDTSQAKASITTTDQGIGSISVEEIQRIKDLSDT